jgi:hypothetical protein
LFRETFENGLLDDPDSWFKYHEARNKTSHMYSQEAYDLVYGLSDDFIKDVLKVHLRESGIKVYIFGSRVQDRTKKLLILI